MVIGSRFMKIKKGNIEYRSSYLNNQKKFGQVRKLGNFIFSFLVFIFHKRYITDTQSGFRAFRPGLVKTINLKSDGFQIETELTIKMLKKGWRIGETPIFNGISTRGSHMKMIMDSLKIVGVILENTFSERTKAIFKSLFRRFYMK